jgi:hypothetical protein
MRYGNVVIAHCTRPTLARPAHVRVPGVRLFSRGHYPVRRRLSPSQVARRAWNPAAKSTSLPPGENARGLALAEKRTKNSGVMIVAFAAVAAWQIYDLATATETPSRALMILQYVLLAGLLIGLAGALLNFLRSQ